MSNIKIYICQNKADKTKEEIIKEYSNIKREILLKFLGKADIINNYFKADKFEPIPDTDESIYKLTRHLRGVSNADLLVFGNDWESNKETKMLHTIAEEYRLNILHI